MIGELQFQPTINSISSRIVEHAVGLWAANPEAILVCESEPMSAAASRLGVPTDRLLTALPQPRGHTTRLVAQWLSENRERLPKGQWVICTHRLHSDRAWRILRKCGVDGVPSPIDASFDSGDRDWKLRSEAAFRLYNAGAEVYCRLRGWL